MATTDREEAVDDATAAKHPRNPDLAVTSWGDALLGRIDTRESCEHVRGLVSMYQERFKTNTQSNMERLYGAEIVLRMETTFEKEVAKYDKLLEDGGCFVEDPHESKISSFAVWTHGDPGEEVCKLLFKQRRDKAGSYQAKVRSMMLEKDYNRFTASLNELYTVSKSLHLRLKAQGCEGAAKTYTGQGNIIPAATLARKSPGPFHAFEAGKMVEL
jgi:hypothetical protein